MLENKVDTVISYDGDALLYFFAVHHCIWMHKHAQFFVKCPYRPRASFLAPDPSPHLHLHLTITPTIIQGLCMVTTIRTHRTAYSRSRAQHARSFRAAYDPRCTWLPDYLPISIMAYDCIKLYPSPWCR
jgi:hypothetical protein